jgi:hypothetical protein
MVIKGQMVLFFSWLVEGCDEFSVREEREGYPYLITFLFHVVCNFHLHFPMSYPLWKIYLFYTLI